MRNVNVDKPYAVDRPRDQPPRGIIGTTRKRFLQVVDAVPGKYCDAIVRLLTVKLDMIKPGGPQLLFWKPRIDALCLLQAKDVRPIRRAPVQHVLQPRIYTVDVPGCELHVFGNYEMNAPMATAISGNAVNNFPSEVISGMPIWSAR